ncbi:MAG: hypothetical protein GY727_00530 [Gammaproteobacteria bacterium]|nr:hypothetical protein [Gammaproteobacteria bacterium]
MNSMQRIDNTIYCANRAIHSLGETRYTANGTPVAAHDGVITPWNRITIPRRHALSCTTTDAPFTVFN